MWLKTVVLLQNIFAHLHCLFIFAGASLVVIFIHASLFNFEAVVNPEESFDLNIEQV